MVIRKLSDKKPKILIFNGSPRRLKSCANQTSKSQKIVQYVIEKWLPFVDFDVIDLSIGKTTIQPCKGCVSTSNGFHCHFPCSCYVKGDKVKTDLMYEKDVYQKLQECDGFIVVSPIHWYSVSSQVKAMFDRLVCANQTITQEQAVEIFGKGNTKNSELTGKTEIWGQHKDLLKNHLEGKWAAFFVHGDNGANDYDGNQPETGDRAWDVRNSVMPLVYQCRYSGINCPDDLVEAFYINQGKPYYQANEDFDSEISVFKKMDNLVEKLLNYLK
jgi:hypothetical protein